MPILSGTIESLVYRRAVPNESPSPLRFDCPACQSSLTVLSAAAGMQGPCPRCGVVIVSPDAAKGLPARVPGAPPPPPPAPDPAPVEKPPESPASRPEEQAPQTPSRSSGLLLTAAFMLTAMVSAVGGFVVGKASVPTKASDAMSFPSAESAKHDIEPDPTSEPETETDLKANTEPQSDANAAAAPKPPVELTPEQTLRSFLDATSWEERVKHVFRPEIAGPAMQRHAADFGDGPIKVESLELIESKDPKHRFRLTTSNIPEGYQVVVVRSEEGLKIDWMTFISFHDDHFKKFIDGPAERMGQFHLLVLPDPKETEASNFNRYLLKTPVPGRNTTAYVRRDSKTYASLRAVFESESAGPQPKDGFPIILSVTKRQTEGGRDYFEISDFVKDSWDD